MPAESARITPLRPDEMSGELTEQLGGFAEMSYVQVMLRNPRLFQAFTPFLGIAVPESNLPKRDRQILVFRTCQLCDERYERAHHVVIARNAGMTDDDIAAALSGDGEGLSTFERTLARFAEELVIDHRVSDETWQRVAQKYSEPEMMEAVATVGCYVVMAMFTRNFDIQLEPDDVFNGFQQIRPYT